MYISKFKVFIVSLIIVCMLYKYNILDEMDKTTNTFGKRVATKENEDLGEYIEDYNSIGASKIYLNNFINVLQNDINTDVSKYIDGSYYKNNIENDKITFINKIKNNLIILDTYNNYHYIEYSKDYTNKDGYKIIEYAISVYKNGYSSSIGYDALKYEKSKDANKKILINIVEYSPYNFKITFPIETAEE